MWFQYDISLSISEMLILTMWPSFILLSKLRSIVREIIRVRADRCVRQVQDTMVSSSDKNIYYAKTKIILLSEQQGKQMPKNVSKCFSIYSFLYGLFFFGVGISHLALHQTLKKCSETYNIGCKVKIPFCNNLFSPTCNCAYLDIRNDNTLTALPQELSDEMTGLRKMYIYKCNLTTLPLRMEKLTEMTNFIIVHNKLKAFNVDILQWKKLHELTLHNNKIKVYNQKSLWTHPTISYVDMSYNVAIQVPSENTELSMPFLKLLAFSNNNVKFVNMFGKTQFPTLTYLFLNGNTFISFPDKSLKETLQYLGISRCKVKRLPQYLSEFDKLKYLDIRDNNISNINNDLKALIKKNQIESYFSGNDGICKTPDDEKTSKSCKPLCSKHCWRSTELNNGYCAYQCDSKECEYDGGDCVA